MKTHDGEFTCPVRSLITPWKSSGTISIFRKGGNGSPKNLVVALNKGGMQSVCRSKETEISSVAAFFVPVAVPDPPCAL